MNNLLRRGLLFIIVLVIVFYNGSINNLKMSITENPSSTPTLNSPLPPKSGSPTSPSLTISPIHGPILLGQIPMLTNLGRAGVDFTPIVRNFPWDVSNRPDLSLTIGSEQLDTTNCQVPNRRRVVLGVNGFGFGSNIIMYANYIIWSAFNPNHVPFTVLYALSHVGESDKASYTYQKLFEETFSFASTITSCSKDSILKGKTSADPPWNGRWTYWEERNTWLDPFYRAVNNELAHGLRALVIREVLRLKNIETRNELERRIDEIKKGFPKTADTNPFTIAIHVRRTDKLHAEAKFVHSNTFIRAMKLVFDHNPFQKNFLVIILTDDPVVQSEFSREFEMAMNGTDQSKNTVIVFRAATTRPERGNEESSRDAFWNVLVDLRFMIDSDAFIGSQSSNLGIIACLLRFQHSCYSVENDSFEWNCRKDKPQ